MSQACPDLFDLAATAGRRGPTRAHLSQCETCGTLARLGAAAASPPPATSQCDAAEPLLAALASAELRAEDRDWLERHLASCTRCTLVAQAVLLDFEGLDAAAAAPRAHAKEVPMQAGPSPTSRTASPVLFVAAAAAAVAIALCGLAGGYRLRGAMEAEVAEAPAPRSETGQTDQLPAVAPAQPQQQQLPVQPVQPTARDPVAPVDRSMLLEEKTADEPLIEELIERARKEAIAERYRPAFALCKRALGLDPDHQQANTLCAAMACRLHRIKDAQRYFDRSKNRQHQVILRQLCLQEGLRDLGRRK